MSNLEYYNENISEFGSLMNKVYFSVKEGDYRLLTWLEGNMCRLEKRMLESEEGQARYNFNYLTHLFKDLMEKGFDHQKIIDLIKDRANELNDKLIEINKQLSSEDKENNYV